MIHTIFFYCFACIAVLSALGVVFLSKPTRALLSLLVTMASLSSLYVSLGASFVAMINLIVYAGAVLVLFLFVIMLLGLGAKDIPLKGRFRPLFIPASLLTVTGFVLVLGHLLYHSAVEPLSVQENQVRDIGLRLFSVYLLPFELISLLLLLAIFAAVSLAKKEDA